MNSLSQEHFLTNFKKCGTNKSITILNIFFFVFVFLTRVIKVAEIGHIYALFAKRRSNVIGTKKKIKNF